MIDPSAIYLNSWKSLGEQLATLHEHILNVVPNLDRIGCAIYDHDQDLLKTFINSTRFGEALKGYEYKLSGSHSLYSLAKTRGYRLLPDIPSMLTPTSVHSTWVLSQGYKSSLTVPMYSQDLFLGFTFFNSRHLSAFSDNEIQHLTLFAALISMLISNELITIQALQGLVHAARIFCDLRDFETGMHLERMARYSRLIAKDIAIEEGYSDEFVEHIYLFAPLHDVGKIGIPDRILLKPGKLEADEWEIMKTHVSRGKLVIDRLIDFLAYHHLPDDCVLRNIVEFHHECLDGTGYAKGIADTEIPIEARITAIADIFDALTNKRPYKAPWTMEESFLELDRLVLTGKLDKRCVEALKNHKTEILEIHNRYRDESDPTHLSTCIDS